MYTVSVGVCAYNEGKNIGACLESLAQQQLRGFEVIEIIAVSSGSTDDTDEVIKGFEAKDHRIRLSRQEKREGKNSAINLFMSLSKGDILVLANADNRLAPGALQALLDPFEDEEVGVTGGHPVPVNGKDSVVGFAVNMLWDMHHRVALAYPKVGELMAFRRLDQRLPTCTQSDEDIIRMELEKKGFSTVYAPQAIVHNKGPEHLRDFVKQRTRVNIGEKYMKRLFDHQVPTWDSRLLFQAYISFLKDNKGSLTKALAAMGLEAYARVYATVYVALDKGDKAVWQQVSSTKDLGKV
ncbi:MAG: glycosyltransferase [Methanomassiliicoccales archaeon]|nr:glycosyltransferase [Methanomassiliicoccales archaeon]MDD1756982.1 glycosyltransferase [Methanomassiliicoccales archaeon]